VRARKSTPESQGTIQIGSKTYQAKVVFESNIGPLADGFFTGRTRMRLSVELPSGQPRSIGLRKLDTSIEFSNREIISYYIGSLEINNIVKNGRFFTGDLQGVITTKKGVEITVDLSIIAEVEVLGGQSEDLRS
jgi:hypothetical protein